MDLKKLTIIEFLTMVDQKKISSLELIEEYEKQSKNDLNVYIQTWFDEAKEKAQKNPYLIPFGMKNIFSIKGKNIDACSKALKNYINPYTSTVAERLSEHCVFLGSTNMDEFAMGGAGITSCYGPAISPWKNNKGEKMCPGGSSSGSAAGLAANMFLAATGTDTGGSIRLPASYCGIVGLKPTYGVLSRYGVIDFASSLDCPGFFTKTIDDCSFLFNQTIGKDKNDPTSMDYVPQKSHKKFGLYIPEKCNEEVKEELEKSAKILESKGYKVVNVNIDIIQYGVPCYYVLAPSEASSNLSRYSAILYGGDQKYDDLFTDFRSENFGEEVQRRLVIGNFMLRSENLGAYYIQARKIVNKIYKTLMEVFKECDFVLMPATQGTAPTMDELKNPDPVKLYMEDFYTAFANLCGFPGLTVPVKISSNKMPFGLQLVSKPLGENLLFEGAKIIEQSLRFMEQI